MVASTPSLFAVDKVLEPIYTGGACHVSVDSDEKELLLMRSGSLFALRDPDTGIATSSLQLEEEENNVTVFAMKDAQTLVTCNTNNVLEVRSMGSSAAPIHSWKAHASPILVLTHHATHPLLATGSADHGVRVWDSSKSYCTHNLKGVHGAIVTVLVFHPDSSIMQLFSASEDGTIAVWDLQESRAIKALKGAHVSSVTALSVSACGGFLLSAGRDQIVNIWNLNQASTKPTKTVAVLEAVESAGWLTDKLFFTAGEKGIVRVWNSATGQCVLSSAVLGTAGHAITQVKLLKGQLVVFTSDLFIFFLDPANLSVSRTMVGHHGEITDLTICNNQIVLSTNGPQLRVYQQELTHQCRLLSGHEEAVISLFSKDNLMVSGSRDHTAIVWNDSEMVCKLTGHTDVVSAVSIGNKTTALIATASADMTLKLWNFNGREAKLAWTSKAHEKDINHVCFTPNDKNIITTSQDKTVRIWKVEDGKLLGTIKGHKRGVWSAAVSPVEQLLATASADRTIKLWSLSEDFNCLKTLEGHNNSVLCIEFSKDGSRLYSAGSDGLVKVWDIKKSECICTIDAHSDRIWTMLRTEDEALLTGDASGILKVWRDVSEEDALAAQMLRDETIIKEQQLSNMIMRKDYTNAILLAMQLEQPHRLYTLFGQIIDRRSIQESIDLLTALLVSFDETQIGKLTCWIRDWNTSLKRAYLSQLLLHVILKKHKTPVLKEIFGHIQPYTERHFEKIDDLLIGSHLIDFVVNKIK